MAVRRDFDAAAAAWDEKPHRVRLAGDIATAIQARLPVSKGWHAMDLGCGTGLLTLQLAPLVRDIVGVDGSRGMLEKLDEKVRAAGCSNVRTLYCDLERDELPEGTFDLITAAMLLHHIPDVAQLIDALRRRLQPGGWLALADLDQEDGSFHEDATGVFHNGFSRECLLALLSDAGFGEVTVAPAAEVVKGERHYPVLLAVGRRCR
ncbi:class I SAM-dependent methyltransferase [Trichlorobacter ammonificans]|uniref:Methyltransferase type 12 n=1 Tax=Trichlorobacter ammonificans TaxID=2916410 RepID=A0ABM9D724_9BACT|nr:class I SAM-dependent methyltransferase [Trichlorobacter ammonificans]CAH2030978.1 Methyltransferase type 12 [Trichlorobacter ammonificans]